MSLLLQPTPKLSLQQTLTLIQQLIQELTPSSLLKVLLNDHPMHPHLEHSKQQNVVYTYELAGSKNLKRTQNNNLFQKLQLMHKSQIQKNISHKYRDQSIPTPQNDQNELKNVSKPTEDNQKGIFRYFSQNIKCYRCKRIGHHDFACLDEYSCFFCISSEHQSQKCPQRFICFKCSGFGHVLNDCPSREQAMVCGNCKRRHFDRCGFLLKGMEHVKQVMVMDGYYYSEEIRCMKCYKYGHYNCEVMQTGQYKRGYHMMNDRSERNDRNDRNERSQRGDRNENRYQGQGGNERYQQQQQQQQQYGINDRGDRIDRRDIRDSRDKMYYNGGSNGNKKHKY